MRATGRAPVVRRRLRSAPATATAVVALALAASCRPAAPPSDSALDGGRGHVHFLIPGAPGGGWDGTARGVGEALRRTGLVEAASYENLSGGGGGRALAHLVATAARQHETLMVSSTPIVLQSLRGRLPYSYRDLTPIAGVIGDYFTFAVRDDSALRSWDELLAAFDEQPRDVSFAGGSVLGGMDHLVTALCLRASGRDPARLVYAPYDTGGKAMAALLSGETAVLTTGLGEAMQAWKAGLVRLLAITSPGRVEAAQAIPTLRELGYDVDFVNWRGFFGPPGLEPEEVRRHIDRLDALRATPEWRETLTRNGWVEMFRPGEELTRFLDEQEDRLATLLGELQPQR